MRNAVIAVAVLAGCKSHPVAQKGELCLAENEPEHLMKVIADPKPDGPKVEPIREKLEVAVGNTRLAVPNAQTLLHDVGGLAVKLYRDGKATESVRLDFARRKTDKLCLYFRPARDLTSTEGWKLDLGDHPRCHCWGAPAAGSGSAAAAGSGLAPAGSGS